MVLWQVFALILLVIWPLAVHRMEVPTRLEQYPWFPDLDKTVDYFLFFRGRFLIGLAAAMLALLCIGVFLKKWDPRAVFRREMLPVWVGIGLFSAGVLLSGFFSRYAKIVWAGMSEEYESLPILIAYLIIFIAAAAAFRSEKNRDFLVRCILAGAALQVLIGLGQLVGYDLWASRAGMMLIGEGAGGLQQTEFIFSGVGDHRVYMSFYHPNYAAVYIMLVLPLGIGRIFGCINPKRCAEAYSTGSISALESVLSGILCLGLLVCLWGTGSRTAMLVLFAELFLFLVRYFLFGSSSGNKWLRTILFTLAVSILAGALLCLTGPGKNVLTRFLGTKTESSLCEITTRDTGIMVNWKGERVRLTMEEEGEKTWFAIYEENGTPCPMTYDESRKRYLLTSPDWEEVSFDAYKDQGNWWIHMYQGEVPWYFVHQPGAAEWQYITLYRKPDRIVNAPCVPTFGYDNALSGRFYIWSRAIPLLPGRLLLGSGADTFALVFPQNDYVSRANIGLDMLMPVISRAHSLYLQTAIQAGLLPALGLVLGIAAAMVISCRKRKEDGVLRREVLWSILAWLLMGITNDSVIPVTPFFCVLLGMIL